MGILYAISIFAFCALLWASISIARHIRASAKAAQPPPDLTPQVPANLQDPPGRAMRRPVRPTSNPTPGPRDLGRYTPTHKPADPAPFRESA